ncbi:MAG: hypothetical protein ACD_9C00157G0003 [uncultured bacterium]|nr:MAG: hypothetical protein ACD_9C00157G0003 [uncultured bacterium]
MREYYERLLSKYTETKLEFDDLLEKLGEAKANVEELREQLEDDYHVEEELRDAKRVFNSLLVELDSTLQIYNTEENLTRADLIDTHKKIEAFMETFVQRLAILNAQSDVLDSRRVENNHEYEELLDGGNQDTINSFNFRDCENHHHLQDARQQAKELVNNARAILRRYYS